MIDEERLRRLAQRLETVATADRARIEDEKRLAELRRDSAFELYAICSNLVRSLNAAMAGPLVELAPADYARDLFVDSGTNLFQINFSGRIVQLAFAGADPMVSTEEYARPYTIHGAVRWFNQQSLEGSGIGEHLLYLCVGRSGAHWEYFDPKTHQRGDVDEEYLAGILEGLTA